MERDRQIVVILGRTKSGKTSLAHELIDRYSGPVRVLDPGAQFGDLGEWPVTPGLKRREAIRGWIQDLTDHGRGGWEGLLVLDDFDRYGGLIPSEEWTDVLVANRHVGLDVMISAHRPQAIPKEALANADFLFLFRQKERRAVAYLREEIGGLADQIPTDRYRALQVSADSDDARIIETRPFSCE